MSSASNQKKILFSGFVAIFLEISLSSKYKTYIDNAKLAKEA